MATTPSERDEWDSPIAHLGQHPAWGALRERAKQRMEAEFHRIAHQLMSGTEIPHEVIEYRRGFFAGMKFLLDQPLLDEKKLAEQMRAEERNGRN